MQISESSTSLELNTLIAPVLLWRLSSSVSLCCLAGSWSGVSAGFSGIHGGSTAAAPGSSGATGIGFGQTFSGRKDSGRELRVACIPSLILLAP